VAHRNVRTRGFKQQLERLPAHLRDAAGDAFAAFLRDPFHPSLRNHPLDDTHLGHHRAGSRSVSITRSYRAIYVTDGDTNVWYWIGSHEDYNNFTGRK
jgi:hypothetical protein